MTDPTWSGGICVSTSTSPFSSAVIRPATSGMFTNSSLVSFGAPSQYVGFAASSSFSSGWNDVTVNGPVPIGLLKNPSASTLAAGPMNSSVSELSRVPSGLLVFTVTVWSSVAANDVTVA